MTTDQQIIEITKIFKSGGMIEPMGFVEDNHEPHMYTIGPMHIEATKKSKDNLLSEDMLRSIPCDHEDCFLSFDEHVCDRKLILTILFDVTQEEVLEEVKKVKEFLIEHKIKSIEFGDSGKGKFIENDS